MTVVLLAFAASPRPVAAEAPPADNQDPSLAVVTSFPGGHGQVEVIDQKTRTIRLAPVEIQQRGWACWWYVRVTGIKPGETLTLDVGKAPWATPDRAVYSLDNRNWAQTGQGTGRPGGIVYRQRIDATEAWFAWGPPFTVEQAHALVAWAAESIPGARPFSLAETRDGRAIPAIQVGGPADGTGADRSAAASSSTTERPVHTVWIQARQHAWEAGSSWVCKGFVNWLGSNDPRAAALREQAEIYVVPIMDVDSVHRGTGGKNQHPQDHNRDWTDAPHWPAVRAATSRIRSLNRQGRFDLFVDLHNPAPRDDTPFFFVPPRNLLAEPGRRNLQRWIATSREEIRGPLAFAGKVRESGPGYDAKWQQISKNWVAFNTSDHVVAVTLETTWNSPHSTADGYEIVGRELGRAIERYLRTSPRAAN